MMGRMHPLPVTEAADSATPAWRPVARWGLFLGPLLSAATYIALDFVVQSPGEPPITQPARATAAVGVLMALWWITEAIPLEATALLPLVLFPLMRATPSVEVAAAPYADDSIFLYLGGFFLALAVEKWGLHRRLALLTLLAVGTSPRRLVGGFMLATAFISMWISNTATTLMMLPIGLSVIHLLSDKLAPNDGGAENSLAKRDVANLATLVLLGIAYAASIGGMGTLIGTPPNAFFKGFLEERGIAIGFGRWMLFAVPFCGVFLLLSWLVLTSWLFPIGVRTIPGGRELIRKELVQLGVLSRGEWIVLVVFLAAASLWVSREWLVQWTWLTARLPALPALSDPVIAMAAALVLFMTPVDWRRGRFALDWQSASRVPWGVLLLFGGGLSLAAAMTATRLDSWLGGQMQALAVLPLALLVVVVVIGVVLFSELASNLATATALLPVLFGVAQGLKLDPLTLCLPAILAASCGFMLPVATPPNAIVFGTGHISMRQMMRAGLWLDLIGIALVPLAVWLLGGVLGLGR